MKVATKHFIIFFFLFGFLSFGQDKETFTSLIQKGDSLSLVHQYNRALEVFSQAEIVSQKVQDSIAKIELYYDIATIHYKLGDNDSAIRYYQKTARTSRATKNYKMLSLGLHGLGISEGRKTNFDQAISYYEKALDIQQEHVKDPMTEARILNGLAGVYITSLDIGNAMLFCKRALVKAKEAEEYEMQANILNTMGICEEFDGNLQKALTHRKQSLAVLNENNITIPVPLLANLGKNYSLLKTSDSAFAYYRKAREMAVATKNAYAIARIDESIGVEYQQLKKYDKSREYLEKSYTYFKQGGEDGTLSSVTHSLSEVYESMGDPVKALAYSKEYMVLQDSIAARSSKAKKLEFQVKYEAKEKETQIALLNKEKNLKERLIAKEKQQQKTLWYIFISALIATLVSIWYWLRLKNKRVLATQESFRFKSVIEAEQKERKRIAQDIHDSIGQSIAVVKMQASALNFTSQKEKEKQEKLLEQVDYVYDEIRNISHNIMPNTLITLGLAPAVKELIGKINKNSDLKVQLNIDQNFMDLNEDQTINLYRIIQEALVNIIKYAKASLVNIDFNMEGDKAAVYIKDDGVGIDAVKIKNLNGIGWKNIFSRVSLLMGKINITSKPNKGTKIAIHLKT